MPKKSQIWPRSFVNDNESSLYYLQSRYYDPQLGRFINIDTFIATGQGILGNNAFAYCLNNPVCYMDSRGYFAISATLAATNWWNPVGWVSAAVLVIESIVFTVGVLALSYELLKPIFDVDLSGKNNPEASGQSAQISGAQASPATPEPPNKNNKNNKGLSLKRITSQLLKREGWDAHQIKREYWGQKAEISKYDLAYNTNNGDVYIITKDGTIVTDTIYNLWEHTPMF